MKNPIVISCKWCSVEFTPKRKHAKTCSIKCRVYMHRYLKQSATEPLLFYPTPQILENARGPLDKQQSAV